MTIRDYIQRNNRKILMINTLNWFMKIKRKKNVTHIDKKDKYFKNSEGVVISF